MLGNRFFDLTILNVPPYHIGSHSIAHCSGEMAHLPEVSTLHLTLHTGIFAGDDAGRDAFALTLLGLSIPALEADSFDTVPI